MEKLNLVEQQVHFLTNLENKGKSQNTLKNYRTDLNIFNQFMTQKGRDLKVVEITNSELKEYAQFLEKKYNSPNSIRRRVQALRIFFDYLITQNLVDENPIKKMVVSPKVVDKPNPTKFPTIQKLKSHLEEQKNQSMGHEKLLHSRNLLLFYLIYGAGLKVSDIEKLHASNLSKSKDKYRILIAPEKRDPYTVTLPENATEAIDEYLALLSEGKNRDGVQFTELLFNANPFKILKGRLSARGIEVIFKDLSKQLDTPITARYLRQACIFKWIGNRVPLSRVKEWMGVQPQYSLKPFEELMKETPDQYAYLEV